MAMVMHESNGRSRIMSCARRQTHAYARLMWEYYSCALLASTSKQHAVERERERERDSPAQSSTLVKAFTHP
jgi:hypothetical protein